MEHVTISRHQHKTEDIGQLKKKVIVDYSFVKTLIN